MRVLISSAAAKVDIIKAFQEALADSGGTVIAGDVDPCAVSFHFADEVLEMPLTASSGFDAWLFDIVKKDRIDLIIPTRDEELSVYARLKTRLQRMGVSVMVSPLESIELCQDKERFYRFCLQQDLPVLPVLDPALADTWSYPICARRSVDKGSRSLMKIEDNSALSGLDAGYFFQPWFEGDEYTVDVFCDQGGQLLSALIRQRIRVQHGESVVGKVVQDVAIDSLVESLTQKIGFEGHITIQLFKRDSEIYLIEVNPRFGGGCVLGFEAGRPTASYAILLYKGEAIPRNLIKPIRFGLCMYRYRSHLFQYEGKVCSQ